MSKINQNNFSITGHLANDPKYRTYGEKGRDLSFAVANNRGYGEYAKCHFLDCKLWGKNAENLQSILSKGTYVAVSGEITVESWEDDKGPHKRVILLCNECEILSPRSGSNDQKPQYENTGYGKSSQRSAPVETFEDDHIPF